MSTSASLKENFYIDTDFGYDSDSSEITTDTRSG